MTAVMLTRAQVEVVTRALAEAGQYRWDTAATWCADCASRGCGCPGHFAYLAPVRAYRELAAELARETKTASSGAGTPLAGLGTTPATTREEPSR